MIARLCWLALMLLHVPPALALVRPAQLVAMYGVDPASGTFALMQHRAALFCVVAVICGWAALRPDARPLAIVTVGISMVSFLSVWWAAGMPVQLRVIALADLVGVPVLLLATWLALRGQSA